MTADNTIEITAMPTVPAIHFRRLSEDVIYGFRSSVPGIVHAFVCPTQNSSIKKRSVRFMTERITNICQKPERKPLAPFTAYTQIST